jgi:hypothetical protein
MHELNPRQMRFVANYIQCGVATQAAQAAGYPPSTAKRAACKLLSNPKIQAAVADGKARLRKKNEYTQDKAVKDLDSHIAGAVKARQYTAVANLMTTKLKLLGMLEERFRFDAGPNIIAALEVARSRAGLAPLPLEAPAIDLDAIDVEAIDITPYMRDADPAGIFDD